MTDSQRQATIEAMARAMNVATDGHDRYWTGYLKSAEATYEAALASVSAEPSDDMDLIMAYEAPQDDEPATDWREVCATLIDIYDDGMNNAPEDRCYVEGAWKEELQRVRDLLTASESCHLCDNTGDIHRADGEWLGECPVCEFADTAPTPPTTQQAQEQS